jgi:imidazole glycerol-phosphate synthase subunit HisF
MLRKRLITVLTFNEGVLFRTKNFEPDYRYTHNFIDAWSVDEMIILNITRNNSSKDDKFFDVISKFASNCFVPLTIGGGIRSLADVKNFLDAGADKVVLNTGALKNPDLISKVAKIYGKQCIVISIDVKKNANGAYEVYDTFGTRNTKKNPVLWAKEAESLGAGEIMLNSIDLDGSLLGYDLQLCQKVVKKLEIPLLICGGAGNWKHFAAALKEGNVSGFCTSNIYHFTETSIKSAKLFLKNKGFNIRE